MLSTYNLLGDKIANDKKVKDLITQKNMESDDQSSGPHIVTTHPSGNLIISIGTKVENKASTTNKKQNLNDSEGEVKQPAKYQKTKIAMNMRKSEDNQSSNRLKGTEDPNLPRVENKNTIMKSSKFDIIFKVSNKYCKIYTFIFLEGPINLVRMGEAIALRKETSVINSPLHSKHVFKSDAAGRKE